MICEDVRNKLGAYVDSELPSAELPEFESHLRECSNCAADALGLMKMKHTTRAAAARYSPTPEFRLRMEQSIRTKKKPSFGWVPRLATVVVAAALLIAAVAVWENHSDRDRTFAELADMHVATLASSNPVDVISTDRHTVKPWFAGKIPFSFNLPELQNSEFTLAGGRVAYFQHNPGAQLLFNLRKHQLSVFIFQDSGGGSFFSASSASTKLAFHMETWSEGGLRYFIIGDAPATDVHALSELMKRAARS